VRETNTSRFEKEDGEKGEERPKNRRSRL